MDEVKAVVQHKKIFAEIFFDYLAILSVLGSVVTMSDLKYSLHERQSSDSDNRTARFLILVQYRGHH